MFSYTTAKPSSHAVSSRNRTAQHAGWWIKRASGSQMGMEARRAGVGPRGPCSPDDNPVELAFSRLRAFLRTAVERPVEGL